MFLGSYLKTSYRELSKNKVYAILNIIGLTFGLSAFIFIQLYVSYEKSFDTFHNNHKNLYRVQYKATQHGEVIVNSTKSTPRVGAFMKEKMPEVIDFARAYPLFGVMKSDSDKYTEDRVYAANPAFLKIFDFKLISGNVSTALDEPNHIVLTESMAHKYFGTTNVLGKTLSFSSWLKFDATITGVVKDAPHNSHFKFDFLCSYETLNNVNKNSDGTIASEDSWDWDSFNTYILLQKGTDHEMFNSKFAALLQQERGAYFKESGKTDQFTLQPITDIHLYSNIQRETDPEGQGNGQEVFFLSIIGVFILVLAWVNYINLTTARSMDRTKEVGIRKTMGGSRLQLIYQFLTEAFLVNFFAFVSALLLISQSIGFFNQLTNSKLTTDLSSNVIFWLMILGAFMIGILFTGLYPALILSSFKPASVLKGQLSDKQSKGVLRKTLIIFQFIVSVTLIAGVLVVFGQLEHMKTTEQGFSLNNTLVIKGPMIYDEEQPQQSKLEAFKNELLSNSAVMSVTASSNVPGEEIIWTNNVKRSDEADNKLKSAYFAEVDYEYFPSYDIKLLAGRNFSEAHPSDTGAVILNLTAARYFGFDNYHEAIDKKIMCYDVPKTIIGVVDDYKQMSAKTAVSPIIFPLSLDMPYYFTVKLNSDQFQSVIKSTKRSYEAFFHGNPFDYFVLDDFFNRLYKNDEQFGRVFSWFAILAIIIACLGLYGLSSFSARQRTKEIGIRKTLGANISSLLMLLSKDFLILIAVANVIAWPIIYLTMNKWLSNFAERISIGISIYLSAGILIMIIALLTVGFKTLQTAKANPVEALRCE
ncbi:MAG: ABC transporter permease [Fulvivirga sp.]